MAAGTCVARVLGAEMTGDPAMLAIGCEEDMEAIPERQRGARYSFGKKKATKTQLSLQASSHLANTGADTSMFLKLQKTGRRQLEKRQLTGHHTRRADWSGAGSHPAGSGPPSLVFDDGN